MDSRTTPTPTWIDDPPDYSGLRATVMGLGRFGGGEAAVRFLVERGARVIATDLKTEDQLAPVVSRLSDLSDVEFRLGRHDEKDFRTTELIVVNPAVHLNNPLLQCAAEYGVPLTSEINLFWLHCPARIIGVTGTNGKSTTATLIHHLLSATGVKSRLGGNIGRSLLNELREISSDEQIVLELSSFQLQTLNQIHRSPSVAIVTNFAPNHLDCHGSLDNYRQAKQTLLRFQSTQDVAILNADDADSSQWPTSARRLYFGSDGNPEALFHSAGISVHLNGRTLRLQPDNPALQGPHNLANLAAAALAAGVAGADLEDASRAIRKFRGLPHRMQIVTEKNGRRFINDSKATTPEAAAAAIDACVPRSGQLILLAGGADKGVNLQPFAERIAHSVAAVALMGETARPLAEQLDRICGTDGPRRFRAPSFESAFDWAVRQSKVGDSVLLSPGCASFGWFEDFEERGNRFSELTAAWTPKM